MNPRKDDPDVERCARDIWERIDEMDFPAVHERIATLVNRGDAWPRDEMDVRESEALWRKRAEKAEADVVRLLLTLDALEKHLMDGDDSALRFIDTAKRLTSPLSTTPEKP